jgi:hypothetical protein
MEIDSGQVVYGPAPQSPSPDTSSGASVVQCCGQVNFKIDFLYGMPFDAKQSGQIGDLARQLDRNSRATC